MIKKLYKPWFFLSLFMHFLFFISVSFVVYEVKSEKKPTLFLPAYIFNKTVLSEKTSTTHDKKTITKAGLLKSVSPKTKEEKTLPNPKISPASTPNWDKQNYTAENHIDKELLKILHDATAAHLIYPEFAMDLKQTGTAEIGFLLEPNGTVSRVVLLKSSGFDLLDNAAIAAVKEISPIGNMSYFLTSPKLLAVDIIFR